MPVKIDPSLIPATEIRSMAKTFINCITDICEDPGFVREFEAWKAKRKQEA